MFYFGDPEDTAQVYISEAIAEDGPGMPEGALEDLDLQDLRHAFVYARMACQKAIVFDKADRAVIDALIEIYDEIFCHIMARDPETEHNFNIGWHVLLEPSTENEAKYRKMAKMYGTLAN